MRGARFQHSKLLSSPQLWRIIQFNEFEAQLWIKTTIFEFLRYIFVNIDVNKTDKTYEKTPLYSASQNGYKDVVELLLNMKNIDINKPDKTHEMTPLRIASKNGHI